MISRWSQIWLNKKALGEAVFPRRLHGIGRFTIWLFLWRTQFLAKRLLLQSMALEFFVSSFFLLLPCTMFYLLAYTGLDNLYHFPIGVLLESFGMLLHVQYTMNVCMYIRY